MKKQYTKDLVDEVMKTYANTRNSPFKTARALGIDVEDVFNIIDANETVSNKPREHNGGYGQEHLIKYIVARRPATDVEWDNTIPAVAKARSDYEAGTHEMATGRDGNWRILYSFPRRRIARDREGYFQPEES